MEQIAQRPDLDTICAYDYVRMKKYALEGDGLKYEDSNPEAKGIKIPDINSLYNWDGGIFNWI